MWIQHSTGGMWRYRVENLRGMLERRESSLAWMPPFHREQVVWSTSGGLEHQQINYHIVIPEKTTTNMQEVRVTISGHFPDKPVIIWRCLISSKTWHSACTVHAGWSTEKFTFGLSWRHNRPIICRRHSDSQVLVIAVIIQNTNKKPQHSTAENL